MNAWFFFDGSREWGGVPYIVQVNGFDRKRFPNSYGYRAEGETELYSKEEKAMLSWSIIQIYYLVRLSGPLFIKIFLNPSES